MNYYAVLDTNVLVSALLKKDSVPAIILKNVAQGIIIPLYNEEIFDEYGDVLHRVKFHFTNRDIQEVFDLIKERGTAVNAEPVTVDFNDIDDVVFYEVVMEKRKTDDAWLVTGNIRHFPKEPFIVTPREMLNIITI